MIAGWSSSVPAHDQILIIFVFVPLMFIPHLIQVLSRVSTVNCSSSLVSATRVKLSTYWRKGTVLLVVVYSMLHPPGVVSNVPLHEDLIHETIDKEWRENAALFDSTFNLELLRGCFSSLYLAPCASIHFFDNVN